MTTVIRYGVPGLREAILARWHRERLRGTLPARRTVRGRVVLRVYDVDRITGYMRHSLRDAVARMTADLLGGLDPALHRRLETTLYKLAVLLRDRVVRPQVEKRLGKHYEESYVEAITVSLLAILLGLGGEITQY